MLRAGWETSSDSFYLHVSRDGELTVYRVKHIYL